MATRNIALPLKGIRDAIIGPVTRLSVSNFVPMCEIKGLYAKARAPSQRSQASQQALDRGTAVHEKLDTEKKHVEIPEQVLYRPHIEYGLKLLDTAERWEHLAQQRHCREVPLFGQIRGIKLYGVADGLSNDTLVENKTTLRMPPQEWKLRLALHQTLVYHYMLQQMVQPGFDVLQYIERSVPAPADAELLELYGFSMENAYARCVTALEQLSKAGAPIDRIHLVYSGPKSTAQTYEFEVDLEHQAQLLQNSSDMWVGDREPMPLRSDGVFSCKFCEYRSTCEFVARYPDALK